MKRRFPAASPLTPRRRREVFAAQTAWSCFAKKKIHLHSQRPLQPPVLHAELRGSWAGQTRDCRHSERQVTKGELGIASQTLSPPLATVTPMRRGEVVSLLVGRGVALLTLTNPMEDMAEYAKLQVAPTSAGWNLRGKELSSPNHERGNSDTRHLSTTCSSLTSEMCIDSLCCSRTNLLHAPCGIHTKHRFQ